MIYFLLIPETDTKGYPRCCFEFGDSRSPLRYVGNDGKNGYVGNDGEGDFKGMTGKVVSRE